MGKKISVKGCEMSALKAYMKMLADGTAFSNWVNPPSDSERSKIVEAIMENDSGIDVPKIRKVIAESKNKEELKRMMDDMLIKEDEFLV